jgi:CRP-like cAMP-binding protein
MILLEELAEVDFVRGLLPEYIQRIAQLAQLQECPAERILFREGEACSFVYLVLRGSVALEMTVSGRGTVLDQTVGPGDLLGWSPLLRLGPMTATARTLSRCRLAALDAAQLLTLGEHEPRFGIELLRRTATAVARRLIAARRAGVEQQPLTQ